MDVRGCDGLAPFFQSAAVSPLFSQNSLSRLLFDAGSHSQCPDSVIFGTQARFVLHTDPKQLNYLFGVCTQGFYGTRD